jgi:ubiquinone/menaquinone biosynthesis C-methylase UbiE
MPEKLTPERIAQFAWGYAPPLIIEAALRNKLFDRLENSPKTASELASETATSERGIRMIANALVSLNLLTKQSDRYSLTPESAAFLVTTKPSFQGGIFKHISRHLIPAWMNLTEIVRTGEGARHADDETTGAKFFEEFVEDIFPMSYGPAQTLAEHLKLASATSSVKVLDLAAGSGVWGIALAQASPNVQVTAVDWPGVLPVTKRVAQQHGVADRFTFLPGNIQEANLGTGHHIATLGQILHSEGESNARQLLKRTFDALAPGGTIAIAEFLSNPDRTGPVNAMIFAVNMLVNTTHGDTFTFPEITSWLHDAGFKNPRTLDAPGPSPMILATK